MGIGIISNFNHSEFRKLAQHIDTIYQEKIDRAVKICVNEGRIMLNEFRTVQNNAGHFPYPKGKKTPIADMGKAQAYAQAHANDSIPDNRKPWINRTFRAARSLHSYVEKKDDTISVGLYHTMPYGAYLEFAHNRKYAVIEPIVRNHAPDLFNKISQVFTGK